MIISFDNYFISDSQDENRMYVYLFKQFFLFKYFVYSKMYYIDKKHNIILFLYLVDPAFIFN